jgi:hypothetical protein
MLQFIIHSNIDGIYAFGLPFMDELKLALALRSKKITRIYLSAGGGSPSAGALL